MADRYDPATVELVAATLESTLSKPIPGVAVAVLDALTAAGWLAPDQRGTREEADRLIAVIRAQERAKAGEDAAQALTEQARRERDGTVDQVVLLHATEIVREVTRATGEEVKSR
jgi:hypothetical protein